MRRLFARLSIAAWLTTAVACGSPTPNPTAAPGATATALPTVVQTAAPTAALPTAAPPTALPAALPTTPTPPPAPDATALPTPTSIPTVPADVVREVREISLPDGFSVLKFADIVRPTSLAFDAAGRLFVASGDGNITVLPDVDGDGRADQPIVFSYGFNIPLGLAFHPTTGDLYVSSNGRISVLRDLDGDLVADEAVNFVRDLPVGLHQNNNLRFGPDGRLYIGIGSTCNACVEADPRSATIMRFDTEMGEGEIVARGLRNPFDLIFHPETGALLATDNGRDDLGVDIPQEELNLIVEGGDYGWPDCWDELVGPGCAGTQQAIAFFEARSSVNNLAFYTGDRFPAEYRGDLFTIVFGSWVNVNINRGIWRIQLTPTADGLSAQTEWFARWPNGWLLGLAVGPDGALYTGDHVNGGIYRISYGAP